MDRLLNSNCVLYTYNLSVACNGMKVSTSCGGVCWVCVLCWQPSLAGWYKPLQCNISSREPAIPLLSPGIKQSPKQINRRPAVVTGAATEPAALSQPRWLPQQQKSRRWFRPGSFVGVHMGPWLKQAKLTKGVRWPSPSLGSSSTCSLPMEGLRKLRRQER